MPETLQLRERFAMTELPIFPLSRRSLLAGAAGSAALLAAPLGCARSHCRPPHQAERRAVRQSAVIDVDSARTDPIPIAIPPLVGGGSLGQDIAGVITNDLGGSGLFRPISPAAFIQAWRRRPTCPISRTGRRSARRRW